jgi:hypothetical protein
MKTPPVSISARLSYYLLCAGLLFAGGVPSAFAAAANPVTERISLQLTDSGSPMIKLRVDSAPSTSSTPLTQALALASADFDEDGVPDLITGYANSGTGGTLSIQRGNIDAIYPNSPEAKARRARGEFTTAAFLPGSKSYAVPEPADFIAAGDFDADGHWDIVTARNGDNKLYWLRGNGHGEFAEPKIIYLSGTVTSLGTGELNRPDGLNDIAVGVVTAEGARLLIYESPEGALRGVPESFPLPAPATALAFGQLDDDQIPDVAIASGSAVITVHGRDRRLSLDEEHRAGVKPAQVSAIQFDSAVSSVVAGDFAGSAGQKLAVLTADGRVRVLERDGSEVMAMSVAAGASGTSPTRLLAAKVSSGPKDDLLVFGSASAVQILTTTKPGSSEAGKNVTSAAAQLNVAASLTADSEVTGVLPMRLNADSLQDLVMVTKDGPEPSVIATASGATYVVNVNGNTNDKNPGDGICADTDGNCSFHAAIQEANAHPGADTINFNIPGGGVPVITLSDQYATFTETVTIDGTTQPGGRVEIAASFPPIQINANNCVIRGLASYSSRFSYAIYLRSSGNIIEGNYLGFKADGTKPTAFGNFPGYGIYIDSGGANNLIGGTTTQARNVISNCQAAIYPNVAGAGTIVRGNYIGTNPAGTAAFANAYAFFMGGQTPPDFTIGGTTAGAGNVISASTVGVLTINGAALVQGNLFGTTADGMLPLANSAENIYVQGDKQVTIGGTTPAARNVISAGSVGVVVYQAFTASCQVQGNFIGTNAAGSGALPNSGVGVNLASKGAVLGGTASGAGNLISGNGSDGVSIVGRDGAYENVIQGNLIGTDVTGALAIPNFGNGIQVGGFGSTFGNQIGGNTPGARNVISGNRENGLVLNANSNSPNRIEGNYVGLNRFGTGALGNRQHGIFLANQANDTIGGTASGTGNIIAYNGGAGVSAGGKLAAAILSNSIFANGGLGLDSGNDGVSPYGADIGEAPVLTSVTTSGSQTTITGKLRTAVDGSNLPYTIQFFSNANPDPTGYGEGQTFIGQTTVTVPGSNVEFSFSATISAAVPPGRYISAVAVGQFNHNYPDSIWSSEFSFCVRVAGDATPENTPLHLSLISPAVGGDNGNATVTIVGEGISQGATVVLRRAGQADIVGEAVVIDPSGSKVFARFNLSARAQGVWDVVVTNGNGASFTIPGGYTVEPGRSNVLWSDIIAHSTIREFRPSRITVLCGNRGNTDAYAVPVFVSGIPQNAKVKLNFDLVPLPHTSNMQPGFDPNHVPVVIDTGSEQRIPLIIPVIPAGGVRAFQFTIEVPLQPAGSSFTLKAFASSPRRKAPIGATSSGQNPSSFGAEDTGDPYAQDPYEDLGKKCAQSIRLNLLGCISNLVGAGCEQLVLDIANLVGAGLSFATSTPDTAAGDLISAGGATAGMVSIGLDAAHCGVNTFPESKILSIISCAFSGASILNDCGVLGFFALHPIYFVQAQDPNDKLGSVGFGPEQYVTGLDPLRYVIAFENKPTATAPAQDVVVTDQLDIAKFDLNTFQLGTISFGKDVVLTPPPAVSEWTTDVDLRPANNLVVRLIAALDKKTGLVTWRFISLDPNTRQPTDDPKAGFLPPNQNAPEGDGAVLFTVRAKSGQPTGTEIRNKARIIFDTNAPIDTPEWLNTLDNAPPDSQVLPLASNQDSTHFQVSWSGSDAGAGITGYDIYVSENGGTFTPWLQNTPLTSAYFDGNPHSSYSFYSVGRDGAGNVEPAPLTPDAIVKALPSGQLLNISTRLRVQSGDNVLIGGLIITGTDSKKILLRGIGPSLANFGVTNALGDTTLELYQGNTLLASNDNWKIGSDGSSQQAQIEGTTIPPSNDLESAILRTLAPGSYTAVLRGKNNLTGIGVVEGYDLDQAANSKLANIATRGFVDSDDNVMIGGLIVGGHHGSGARVLVRAIGPSLTAFGVPGALSDPMVELRDENGSNVGDNDDWKEAQQASIEATSLAPKDDRESAILTALPAGNYTAIVRGKNNTTGVGLVEVYNVE